jgi:hypothetical protein
MRHVERSQDVSFRVFLSWPRFGGRNCSCLCDSDVFSICTPNTRLWAKELWASGSAGLKVEFGRLGLPQSEPLIRRWTSLSLSFHTSRRFHCTILPTNRTCRITFRRSAHTNWNRRDYLHSDRAIAGGRGISGASQGDCQQIWDERVEAVRRKGRYHRRAGRYWCHCCQKSWSLEYQSRALAGFRARAPTFVPLHTPPPRSEVRYHPIHRLFRLLPTLSPSPRRINRLCHS